MTQRLTALMVRGMLAGQILLVSLVVVTVVGLGVGVLDRRPPFAILKHDPIAVTAGQWANINVPVYRDTTRKCDVAYSRFLFDSHSNRIDLNTGFVPWEQIMELDRRTPGRLLVTIPVPPLAAPGIAGGVHAGPALLSTSLEYTCNKGHMMAPIKVQGDILLDIMP